MLKATMNRGFSLTFENGLTISVQFGGGNYCSNRNTSLDYQAEMKQQITECQNAEIAIWDKEDIWFDFGDDQVKGYVNADDVAMWIIRAKCAKDITHV
jgi:hypothetical protein